MQVLELIKTLVNVESFAFVLALDDEVIERGFSHRYQAYQLAGKKPEMPITGFEYLEKIVHVPFRLPALTYSEANNFLVELERQRSTACASLPQSPSTYTSSGPWFCLHSGIWAATTVRHVRSPDWKSGEVFDSAGPEVPQSERQKIAAATITGAGTVDINFADFALYCFDTYVPRKLARLVELFYQVEAVAAARGDGRKLEKSLGGSIDVRVVLSLLMLQLFQPELYRVLRRSGSGLGESLNGKQGKGDKRQTTHQRTPV